MASLRGDATRPERGILDVLELIVLVSCWLAVAVLSAERERRARRFVPERIRLLTEDRFLDEGDIYGLPRTVRELIRMGPAAGRQILPLLENQDTTSLPYMGDRVRGPLVIACKDARAYKVGDVRRAPRYAKVSDIADYLLRNIYGRDVGFRSFLPAQERRAAIDRWTRIVERARG